MTFGDTPGPAAPPRHHRARGRLPGNFFTSRKWTFEHGMLIIRDFKGQPLAQLSYAGDHFEGQDASGGALYAVETAIGHLMAEYELYCFAQSGNAYRAALMLNLIGADWRPLFVDFFGKGVPRTPSIAARSTKWARFRCSCTAQKNSASPA